MLIPFLCGHDSHSFQCLYFRIHVIFARTWDLSLGDECRLGEKLARFRDLFVADFDLQGEFVFRDVLSIALATNTYGKGNTCLEDVWLQPSCAADERLDKPR